MQSPTDRAPVVLLVDADGDSLAMYSTIATFHGMEPVRCDEPGAAVARALECEPAAVVFGMGVRAHEDVEVLRELRTDPRTSHLPVLVTTTSLRAAGQAGVHEVGPDAVLLKPCTPTQLVAMLTDLLQPGAVC